MELIPLQFEITDNTTDTTHGKGGTDTLFVTLGDKRLMLCIDQTARDLSIRVYPYTKGELWDAPFTEFKIDYREIKALEGDI